MYSFTLVHEKGIVFYGKTLCIQSLYGCIISLCISLGSAAPRPQRKRIFFPFFSRHCPFRLLHNNPYIHTDTHLSAPSLPTDPDSTAADLHEARQPKAYRTAHSPLSPSFSFSLSLLLFFPLTMSYVREVCELFTTASILPLLAFPSTVSNYQEHFCFLGLHFIMFLYCSFSENSFHI